MSLMSYIPLLFKGAGITIAAWIAAASISLLLGTTLGIISCNYLCSSPFSVLIRTYTFITKGIPAYVQILIAYFVIPQIIGINIPGFIAAIGALALCSSGYVTEIVRGGINSIDRGQWDASKVLGYSLKSTLYYIIMPQTLRIILPSLIGEFEQLLKSTSLLATIGITELTRTGMNIISRELNPLPIYLTIAAIYLLFSAILQILLLYAERRTHYHE